MGFFSILESNLSPGDEEMNFVQHLECPKCGETYDATVEQHLCTCGAPLLVRYDLEGIAQAVTKQDLKQRQASLWRYSELLPMENQTSVVSLGESMTPLYTIATAGKSIGLPDLWIKDEGRQPTGSFKDRGAAVGVTRAKELGVAEIAMPTNGNAGGAWAAYAAKAGIRLTTIMPKDAPEINQKECFAYGAQTYLVDGLISDAGKIIAEGVKQYGWYDASTLKEPYRIEGKKTMGLEIAEQFDWQMPDAILYPAGGGVGLIGIWKALKELQEMGWVQGPLPKMICVQATGCAPLVKAFEEGRVDSEFWPDAHTVAGGIRVPKALGDFLVLEAVRESGGTAIAIEDEETIEAMLELAKVEGAFICPEGATTLVAARKLRESGFLKESDRVVLLNTGTGLKYPDSVHAELPTLAKEDRL
jgi:threonine synthase